MPLEKPLEVNDLISSVFAGFFRLGYLGPVEIFEKETSARLAKLFFVQTPVALCLMSPLLGCVHKSKFWDLEQESGLSVCLLIDWLIDFSPLLFCLSLSLSSALALSYFIFLPQVLTSTGLASSLKNSLACEQAHLWSCARAAKSNTIQWNGVWWRRAVLGSGFRHTISTWAWGKVSSEI